MPVDDESNVSDKNEEKVEEKKDTEPDDKEDPPASVDPANVNSTEEIVAESRPDEEPDGNEEPTSAVAERAESVLSPASEKYESAEEELESGRTNDEAAAEKEKDPDTDEMEVDPTPVEEPKESAAVIVEEAEGTTVQEDENSNSSSHLQDIEMTNVDENRVKNEDTVDDENNRSMDQSNVQDPFDQVKQATNDGGESREEKQDDSSNEHHKGDENTADNAEDNNKASNEEQETNREETDGNEEPGETSESVGQEEGEVGDKQGEVGDKQGESNSDQQMEESTATDDAGQEGPGSPKESSTLEDQPMEEESSATVDDLTGGENENVCLLPDDERPISEEDKERAIAEEEAAKEAERVESEARESEENRADDGGTSAEKEAEPVEGSTTETEKPTGEEEGSAEAAETQIDNVDTIEIPDDDAPNEEVEADGATSGVPDESPSRENQIRELSTPALAETCAQCKKESTLCCYTMRKDDTTTDAVLYICSFDCVASIRTEFPGKFELIQQRVTIVPILGTNETCVRCSKQMLCKFRYRLEENSYKYVCDSKCVEHFTTINSEKYSLSKKRYMIEEKVPPLENKKCVHCSDTKSCAFGFVQDDEELFVCNDCLNLFLTEHPDLFRVNRRRLVRVRNLPKASPTLLGTRTTDSAAGMEVVKFTARSDEEAEAARLDRETSFLRRCFVCQHSLLTNTEQWLQWETMDFCGIKCLRVHQNRIGEFCIYCQQAVSVQSMGKYCVRFGFSVCQFCSATCLDNYKKKLISCSYCQKDVSSKGKRYVARVGDHGVFKDFCSQLCHKQYQSALNPTLKHKRHVCAVCNNEKVSKIIVHLEGREHYFCSTPCFSAFKFVNNVNPDECGMCQDYFERKSSEAYTIFSQTGLSEEGVPFCTQMCLNLYIISHRQIVACHWCKVKKYNFDMIQRAAGKVMLCSLHCLSLAEASVAAKTMQEIRCDHCMLVRTPQYHLTMSDGSLRNFCTYQCVMSFQSQFNKPPLTVHSATADQEAADSSAPVPTGLPKRIRKTGNISIPLGNSQGTSSTPSATPTTVVSKLTMPAAAPIQSTTPLTTRTRERSTRTVATGGGTASNGGSAKTNLPVISSVHSLAKSGVRGTRSKSNVNAFVPGTWPELRVTLEPLMNIPPSGTIPLSSILPPAAGASSGSASSTPSVRTTEPSATIERSPSPADPPASPSPPSPVPSPSPPPPPAPPKIETRTQIVTIPPTPVQVANASTMCKPSQVTRSVSCRPIQCSVECQTDDSLQRKIVIPIPVPIYVPVPMFMYSMPTPVPVPIPLPIPVPVFIPTTRNSSTGIMKEIKKIQDKMPSDPYEAELLMMAEMVAGDKKKDESDSDSDDAAADDHFGGGGGGAGSTGGHEIEHNTSFSEDLVQMALKMASNDYEETHVDLESAMQANTISQQQQEHHHSYTDLTQHHHQQQLLMLEHQRQQETPTLVTRGRKRGMAAASAGQRSSAANNNTQQQLTTSASKRIKREQISEPSPEPVRVVEPVEKPDANMCLKYTFGVNAWKQWVLTKNADLEKSSIRRKPFKSDILQLTADELNFSLCLFVKEVRKPNGTEYAPDTIYYLVLGIQQYLFENGRVENIFTDPYYERFTDCLDEVAKKFSVLYNDSQFIVTRVEEEHLWECKQLGAHSPHVLLSTLMFFNTKHFNLVSVEEHMELSFSHIMKHWKRNPHQGPKSTASRNVLLRFYPPQSSLAANSRKKKVYEQQENEDNPLRCPVKLYEFYLSKCPESVKTRNDVFYLQPERSCVPDSPVWYSTQPLSKESLSKMLHRVKMVKEINIALLTS
ncbi:zinc finger MYM-type protein 4 [Anopheles ziemanni]|nr:zinc finger MYM-type protein 4 [Anopheles ziemanni]